MSNFNLSLPFKLKNYGNRDDDTYSLMLKNFIKDVKTIILTKLMKDKHMSEDHANDFIDDMFKSRKMLNDIENLYTKGSSKKDCADAIMIKYYGIVKVNTDKNDLAGCEESDINENLNTTNSLSNTSTSLFWFYISKINELKLKFKLDVHNIKDIKNSLNNDEFLIFMQSDNTYNKYVINTFKHSKLLSFISKNIPDNNEEEVSFYVAINKDNNLEYGYIINEDKYQIGFTSYSNYDIAKLSNYIESENKIDFNILSKKFKSITHIIYQLKHKLYEYLHKYKDIYLYINVINDNLVLVIENKNMDVFNKKYLINIIENNIKFKYYHNLDIETQNINNTDHYYISIK
jgi:hypothetical protein